MKHFNDLRLRCFIFHLVFGFFAILVGIGIIMAVFSEMINEYDASSGKAYLIGVVVSVLIILFGLMFIRKGKRAHIKALRELSDSEIALLQSQLNKVTAQYFDKRMIVTEDFIITYVRKLDSYIKVFKIENLVACFGRTMSVKNDSIGQYELVLCDKSFKPVTVVIKGVAAVSMPRTRDMIMARMPFILNEELDDKDNFIANCEKNGKRKTFLKIIDKRRNILLKAGKNGFEGSMKELIIKDRKERKQKIEQEKAKQAQMAQKAHEENVAAREEQMANAQPETKATREMKAGAKRFLNETFAPDSDEMTEDIVSDDMFEEIDDFVEEV